MWLLRTASGYYTQELYGSNISLNKCYMRTYTAGSWTAWVEKGVTGPKGDKGDTGSVGPTGATGPTGASGVGVITKLNGSTITGKSIYAPITGGTGVLYGMGTGSAPQWLTTNTFGLYLKSTGGGGVGWSELSIDDGELT